MTYANRDSGGMTQDEIEKKLISGMDNERTFGSLFKSGEKLIKQMQDDIKNTRDIPYREVTGGENKLNALQNDFRKKYEEIKNEEVVSSKATSESIKILTKRIDDRENLTLNLLLLTGCEDVARRNRILANIPCDIDENGRMTCKAGSENLQMNQLEDLFSSCTIIDHYQDGWGIALSETSERDVDLKKTKYRVDYTQCSDNIKKKVRRALGILDDIVCVAPAKKSKSGNNDNNNDNNDNNDFGYEDNSKYIGYIYIGRDGKAVRESEETGSITECIGDLPLGEGLIIQEVKSYNASSKVESYRAEQRLKNNAVGKIEEKDMNISPEDKPEFSKYLDFFGGGKDDKLRKKLKELGPEKYNKFIIATENRVRYLVNYAHTYGYDLQHPPISKLWVEQGLMELNLRERGYNKKIDICVRSYGGKGGKYDLGEELYNIIDKNFEDEYEKYLNNSILSKRQETQFLAPITWIIKSYDTPPKDCLKPNEVKSLINGLDMLIPFFEAKADDIGHAYLTNLDKKYAKILNILQTAISNLNTGKYFSKNDINKNIINVTENLWTNSSGDYESRDDIYNILFDENQANKEKHYRKLSEKYGYTGNQEQASRIISEKDDKGNRTFEIKGDNKEENAEINKCLKKIDNLLSVDEQDINYDNNGQLLYNSKLSLINELYRVSEYNDQGESLQRELEKQNIIPSFLKNNEKILEVCKNIKNTLQKKEERMKYNTPKAVDIKSKRLIEFDKLNNILKDKGKLDNEQKKRHYILDLYLNKDTELGDEIIDKTINNSKNLLRYEGINDIIYHNFALYYAGEYGSNSEIVNDIQGYGRFTLSDKNAELFKEILVDIVISAATRYIGGGILAFGIKMAKLGISAARATSLTNTLIKGVNGVKKYLKVGKYGKKIATYTKKAATYSGKTSGKILREMYYSSVSDFGIDLRNGNDPLENFNLGDNVKDAIKTVVSSRLWNKVKIPANNIQEKLRLKIDPRDFNLRLPRETISGTLEQLVEQPVMNLVIGKKDANGNRIHSFEYDDHMVGNIAATLLARRFNSISVKNVVKRGTNAPFLYYYDDEGKIYQGEDNTYA